MRAAAVSARADGDGVNSGGERNIRVRGRALDAGLIADRFVGGAKSSEQWRIRGEFPAGAAAEQLDFPFELAFRTIAGGVHFVADTGGDAFAERGFETRELVLALGAHVHFNARFVGN